MILTSIVLSSLNPKLYWLPILLSCLLILFLGIYAFSYLYCLLRNPDLLRSERYGIQKMAIQHGLLGDSESGLFDPSDQKSEALLIEDSGRTQEHEK